VAPIKPWKNATPAPTEPRDIDGSVLTDMAQEDECPRSDIPDDQMAMLALMK
jgi:hypothetical protein